MSILALARPEVRAFEPYRSARLEAGRAEVMLNANESPWAPPGRAGLNRYPEPQPEELRARLAGFFGVPAAGVLLARGSDEAIDLLLRAFCRPGRDAVLISPPTFGMYAVAARLQGAAVHLAPLAGADFALDAEAVLGACTAATRLVFVCAPNNPTGGLVPTATIERLATALRGRALVVVDEAYVEYAGTPSAAELLPAYENLVVLRTLSKAWGLAGARIGALLATPEIVQLLCGIMAPYPLPLPAVAAALAVVDEAGAARLRRRVGVVRRERERLAAALTDLPAVRAVLPSAANFLAVRFRDAGGVLTELARAGILVRDIRSQPRLEDALRISIGTPAENRRLLRVLRANTPGESR